MRSLVWWAIREGHHPVKVEYAGSIPAQTVWMPTKVLVQRRGGTRIGHYEGCWWINRNRVCSNRAFSWVLLIKNRCSGGIYPVGWPFKSALRRMGCGLNWQGYRSVTSGIEGSSPSAPVEEKMKTFWCDLKTVWRVLLLRGTAREAWRLVATSLTRPGSFDGAQGIEVGAQVFPKGSKWMSGGWCIPCGENRGRMADAPTTTGGSTPARTWRFNVAPDYGITGMER